MRVFTDAKNRSWEVVINGTTIKRAKGMLSEDLNKAVEPEWLGSLLADKIRLMDIIYVLCRDQAEERNITDEEFGRGFDGDCFEAAGKAFLEELTDFFPKAMRGTHRRMMQKGMEIGEALLKRADKQIDELNAEAEAEKIDRLLRAKMLDGSSGNSPASSESIPVTSLSENS